MTRTTRFVAGALVACAVGQPAHAAFVGGAFVTRQEWNDAATAVLGQTASVYRLMFAFDSRDGVTAVVAPDIHLSRGRFFQQTLVGNTPPEIGLEPFFPDVRWDTYLGLGNLYQPSLAAVRQIDFGETSITAPAGNSSDWFNFLSSGEPVARAPGEFDANGDQSIPADLDPSYFYLFGGQFTVLGHEADVGRSPVLDGGYIDADIFRGSLGSIVVFENAINGEIVSSVQIIPAPGAASLLALAAIPLIRRR